MTTLGAVFVPQLPPERLIPVARAADEAGLEELWLWEDCFRESGVASAAAVLAITTNLRVGMGLLPVPLRNVALTAMEVATLERLFPGRLHVGIGHGVQSWMEQVGARVESPLTLLREYGTALKALLLGEQVTTSGRYVNLDQVALDWPPAPPPPLWAGAEGPKSLRLCGQLADGTILTGGTSPDDVRRARGLVDEGRASVGRTDDHRVAVYVMAATGAGADERVAREWVRWERDPAPPSITGDAQAFADGVARWAEAGADTIVLQPTADEPDLEGFLRFIAQEVQPLVR